MEPKKISREVYTSDINYLLTSSMEKPVKHYIKSRSGSISEWSSGNDNSLDLSKALYPSLADKQTRRSSFDGYWHPTHCQNPDDLVELGFFYAGYSDCARCFYCGLGLKYWRPDHDAALQHAKYRPHCLYIQSVKGLAYIDSVQALSNVAIHRVEVEGGGASNDVEEEEKDRVSDEKKDTTTKEDEEEDDTVLLSVLEGEYNYMKKRLHCTKCKEENIECVNLPCGHVVFCRACGDLESICCICNKDITAITYIYMA